VTMTAAADDTSIQTVSMYFQAHYWQVFEALFQRVSGSLSLREVGKGIRDAFPKFLNNTIKPMISQRS